MKWLIGTVVVGTGKISYFAVKDTKWFKDLKLPLIGGGDPTGKK
jgi:hypothetical protein